MPACSRRVARAVAVCTVAIVVSAGALSAHDFWLVPDAFQVASGGTISIRGQSSTKFPTSGSATAPDRVAEARVVGATSDERITDLSVSGTSLLIRHRPAAAGQRIVAVALAGRSSRVTPAALKRYIALEGAPELADHYEREGAYPKADTIAQTAAKFAKTVVEVGSGGPRAFAKVVGHALELVPVDDPSALRAGDTIAVRLLYHGRPVPGVHLRAGAASLGSATDAAATTDRVSKDGAADPRPDLVIATGGDGVARVPLGEPGLWNVRTLYAAPQAGGADAWEVYFATLVFDVRGARGTTGGEVGPNGSRAAPASDSADVVATVGRFHAALAAGDSAGALALLADDVTILESGDVETRDAYRSHHLNADIAYARAVPSTRTVTRVVVVGDAAWVSGTSTTRGQYNGRDVNSAGAELVVLTRAPRAPRGWAIRAIHWSSRRVTPRPTP